MNSVSKVKIAVGYTLLLGVLFFSLFFVHREMEHLMLSDNRDVQWTDSLITLLRKKDANTIYMLRVLSETNDSMVSTREIENIIATRQDSFVTNQRVQQRIITHRDTVVTKPRKKGFFRRLGEVFVPPKKDTAIQVKTSLEYATDTVINVYNPVDSLQEKLRAVAQQQKEHIAIVQRRRRTLQRMDRMLTARIDSLLKGYEQETLQRARKEAEYQQSVRHHSIKTISGIAVGAVLLSVFFLIIIGRDITRSNRYRRELEEARRRAEDLLATREKMMLAITHDFKAPLGSIMGYADLLSRLTVDERQRFYLDNMKTSSEHLLKLVVDLLDFHRLDLHKAEINRVTFHPARLLEEIHVSFEPLTSAKGLELHCDIAPELESTYICDPLRLRQIINNLLSNAVKFADEGSITMTARYEERRLVVAIADTGKGMEPADRERIFQEFTRLPGAQGKEGFGLGLSIVRMLVLLLEGTIDVDSVPGKGSTFTLRVPLFPVQVSEDTGEKYQETETGISSALSESMPASSQPSLRVLLIDDDRIQLTLTAAMLQHSGIASVSCMQLDELLDALRSDTFDVLLTDVQMPAINGFDLLKLLRASNLPQAQAIPVIAVTARSDMKPEEFKEYGFAGCLHKPFTVAELFRELNAEGIGQTSAVRSEVAAETVEASSPDAPYDFSALTAFSGDDPEAAKSIMESFVTETRLNAERLQKAADAADMDEVAAVSHKMIPLFTLIGATELVAELKILEGLRGTPFTAGQRQRALRSLALIEDIIRLQTRAD
ncbi:hybrid sensor histidine kinase/response regulator [Bacteroides sp. NSJ-48]|uniref:hybrid sensor histidine kinase/response regulator n=1 Tax=Bacteroides sp. NSJ-48 TaxID=2763020 RepID=UPI00164CD9BA|nr:ATP-binding protein [Bacteroides sp. NSJ-48]MBC5609742.1 response regulator [Bacteroides sp. NSJ-48]